MKNTILGIFGISIFCLALPSLADGGWHKVLSCDGGAAVIDNRDTYTVGRSTLPATTAQIVIRNPQIVRYFATSLSADDQSGNGYSDGYEIIDGQWIASLVPQATFPAGADVTSFTVAGIYGSQVQVTYDGTGLSVKVMNDHNQTANWYFRSCSPQ